MTPSSYKPQEPRYSDVEQCHTVPNHEGSRNYPPQEPTPREMLHYTNLLFVVLRLLRPCTPLSAPVPVRLADSSGSLVLARSFTVLPCPAVPSGSLSSLHLPSFSTNMVSTASLQDAMVTITTPGGQRVSICTCTRTGRHLTTFTRRPRSILYTVATQPPHVAAYAQVFASCPVAPPCSCRLLSHQTLLWHHHLGHPSLPRLRGMHSHFLVSGLPRSLPPLPPSPAPPCLPCVEGRQRAAPHSSSFPRTTAPLLTFHMDVWGPARVRRQGRECYFVLVVERFRQDLPVLRLHCDRGGEFSSNCLRDFCRGEGITQSFMLPASPHKNGIAERRIGLVIEVARTSMIHAAAPHFLWPFAVRYAAHQLKLWPRVSLPDTSPTLRWTGEVGDPSVLRVWGSHAFVCDRSADKPSASAFPCVFLGFSPDAPGWQFYHPTSRRFFPSQDVTFDESCAEPGGAEPGGAEPEGVEPGNAESEGAESGGAEPRGSASSGGPAAAGAGFSVTGDTGSRGVGAPAGAGGAAGAAAPGPGGARTKVLSTSHTDPEYDLARAPSPTVSHLLATVVTDPSFESTAVSALIAELVDFAAACRLYYATALVAESESADPPFVGSECALGTDVLEDRQEDFECLAAAVPHFASMLLAPEGEPDAPDIPTPRSYTEAITGPYSYQWQAAMDAEMASWKYTCTYVDAVPPSWGNIVDGMWIFIVKRPPGSRPAFKARYIARGFTQRHGVDFFQTFSPTPKMTTLWVLQHGSLHEEIWLRRPPGFTGSFPAGTQWSLRRPVYGLRQAPREWHDTLRTTLAALVFTSSSADLLLFLRTDTSLPPFYVLVYVLQCFGVQFSLPQPTPLSIGHSLSAPPSDESVEPSGPYPELVGCLMHRKVHWDAAKRVLHYLWSASGMELVLGGGGPVVLTVHADASWVDDSATLRSSQGYTFSLASGSVSWRSTRSSSVLSSSCEAEIYAGAMAAQELRWLT
ncbi:unnamed protein product [Closterium sp. NIES-53]